MKIFKFKDGTTIEGVVIAETLFVFLIKSKNNFFYLINKEELDDNE